MRNKFMNFEELLRCALEVKSTTKNLNGYVTDYGVAERQPDCGH
jgi:hypothetical protein